MGRRSARVDDPLGDALVVEVGELLAEEEVLPEGRSPETGLERVLVIGDGLGEVRRQDLSTGVDPDAVEGAIAGIETLVRGRTGLGGGVGLAEGAAGYRGVRRLRGGAGLGRPRGLADLAGLVAIVREGGGQGLRVPRLAYGGICAVPLRTLARAADGGPGGALSVSGPDGPSVLDGALSVLSHGRCPPSWRPKGPWESFAWLERASRGARGPPTRTARQVPRLTAFPSEPSWRAPHRWPS